MFGPKRGSFLIVFDKFFKDFLLFIFCIVLFLFGKKDYLFQNAYVFVIALASPVFKLTSYFTTTYEINEIALIIKSGLFTKKKTEIPVSTITTVDFSQNVLYQIFGVYKLKIDNSTQVNEMADKSEATLALKKCEAFKVKQLLLQKNDTENTIEEAVSFKETDTAKVKDFILYGLLRSKFIYFFGILTVISGAVQTFFKQYFNDAIKAIDKALGTASTVIVIIISLYILSILWSLIISIITYYDYKIFKTEKSINIEYGFFEKKKYSLLKEKISGVCIKQSLLMRLMGYYTIELFVIGYGDKDGENNKEEAMLFPIANKARVIELLSTLLPEYQMPESFTMPAKKSLHYFFFTFRFIFSIALTAFSVFVAKNPIFIGICIFIFALIFISIFLEYKSTGIDINEKNVSILQGQYSKKITIIETKSIESVASVASLFKRKKKICHTKIGFLAPLRVANLKIKNTGLDQFEKLQNIIEY